MEEIESIIKAVAGLPNMAIWALVIFYGYKVTVIGSVYGVVRFVISKGLEAYTSPKREQINIAVDEIIYCTSKAHLIGELQRIIPPGYQGSAQANEYVKWLSDAITQKLEKDGPPKK